MSLIKTLIAIVLIVSVLLFIFHFKMIKSITKAFRELSKAKKEKKKTD